VVVVVVVRAHAVRRAVRLLVLLWIATVAAGVRAEVVNDVTRLNPIAVARVVTPGSADEVRRVVASSPGPISIGGGRYSMGGQIATDQALFLDMRAMDHVLAFSPKERTITVEPGITWRQIQEKIDPANLSLAIMQSYANFTVGGSLSVNAHGRYVDQGPLIRSVRSIAIVLADGRLVEASPSENSDIFYGAIGGYGGLGVIVSATLALEPNDRLERHAEVVPLKEYTRYFDAHVRRSRTAVLHNADIYPPAYDTVMAITYAKTDRDVTVPDRLRTPDRSHWLDELTSYWIADLPFGKALRQHVLDPWRLGGSPVVWRNYEASYDVRDLEPASRERSTYVLQEYFVPVASFDEFAAKMADIFTRYGVNVLNVSIRHASEDPGSLLAWARHECFAFVVYYQQGTERSAQTMVGIWTRELIDAALSVDGSYYLPYQIHATDEQFRRAYPRAGEFFALKRRLDPTYKFRNRLWARYLPAGAGTTRGEKDGEIGRALQAREGYARPGDQTYLTLPEWYVVYSADEYAAFLRRGPPSAFPYFASIGQFWRVYRAATDAAQGSYHFNWGYQAMLWTVGASFTAEYAVKGVYENTVGRLTEWLSPRVSTQERNAEDGFMADVAGKYAAFIHATPWYEFPYTATLRALWSTNVAWNLRALERRTAFTIELAVKAAWAWVIKAATGAAYAPEESRVLAWVRTGAKEGSDVVPGVHTEARLDVESSLVALPRYEGFAPAVAALARANVPLLEVAGNRTIVMTVIAPAGWNDAGAWGHVVVDWPILTQPEKKRVAIAIPVDRLSLMLEAMPKGVAIDHVYDY
jgi:FAD/FMN-containing dehydrogenase